MLFGVVAVEMLTAGSVVFIRFKGYAWFVGDLQVINSCIWLSL